MGVSVSASRGAGDRAGTITLMCLALMFQALFLVTAARNRLRAPAHPLGAGVRAIAFFFAVAVLLGVQSGAEDLAAARTRLLAEAQITPIFVVAIFVSAVAVVRGIVPGANDVVFRKWATGPEGAGGAGLCGNQPVCRVQFFTT